MKLKELLNKISEIQEQMKTSPVFICGGVCRDKYMNQLNNISDIDLTSGDHSIDRVSYELYSFLNKNYNITRKVMEDGHSSIFVGNIKIDFSSNFITPNIDQLLLNKGISKPTSLQKEIYSRDFTCNSLLIPLSLKSIIDPTKNGFKDIKEKKIKTCLDPAITLTSNKNRVIRSIYLAVKLNFNIDSSITDFVKKNPESVKISSEKSLKEKLNESFTKNPDRASALLTEMNLWDQVPVLEIMMPYYKGTLK
jgi:poly(A) polymerase